MLNAYDCASIPRTMSDLATRLEREVRTNTQSKSIPARECSAHAKGESRPGTSSRSQTTAGNDRPSSNSWSGQHLLIRRRGRMNAKDRRPLIMSPKLINGKVWIYVGSAFGGGYQKLPENDPKYNEILLWIDSQRFVELLDWIYNKRT
jgi:hypothetical protein